MALFSLHGTETVDINLLLSMSKLSGNTEKMNTRQQAPQDCADMITQLSKQFPGAKLNIRFVYTDALYLNKNDPAAQLAEKTLLQMVRHQEAFKKLNTFNVDFLSWNQTLLQTSGGAIESALESMRKRYKSDAVFARLVNADTQVAKRGETPDSNDIAFILQELAVMEMLRRKDTGADQVIIAYPGAPLKSDLYLRDAGRAHPLGKSKEVTHRAFWADVGNAQTVTLYSFPLPQAPRAKQSFNANRAIAASIAAVLTLSGAWYGISRREQSRSENSIIAMTDGSIVMSGKNRITLFPDRNDLSRQVAFVNSRADTMDTRDNGVLAYEREKAVKWLLTHS